MVHPTGSRWCAGHPWGTTAARPNSTTPLVPTEEAADGARLLAELAAIEHRTFPGRVNASELSWVEQTITRMVKTPDGDFRDWDAIRSWAADIARALAPGARHT